MNYRMNKLLVVILVVCIASIDASYQHGVSTLPVWLNDPHPDPHPHNGSDHYDPMNCTCIVHEAHHASLFALGAILDDNPQSLTVIFLMVTALSIFFEKVTGWLEKKTKQHHHIAELVTAVYREIMLLGFISLCLFFVQQTPLRSAILDWNGHGDETTELFEFIHMFIFFAAIFFIVVVLVLLVLIRGTWKRWKKLEAMPKTTILAQYAQAKAEKDQAGRCWLLNPCLIIRYNHARQNKQFYLVRQRFVDTQIEIVNPEGKLEGILRPRQLGGRSRKASTHGHTQASESKEFLDARAANTRELNEKVQAFNFGKYLRRAVRHDTMEILEIDWRVWLVIMCFGIANVIRLRAGGQFQSGGRGIYLFLALGAFFFLLFLSVYLHLRRQLYVYYTKLKRTTQSGRSMYDVLERASSVAGPDFHKGSANALSSPVAAAGSKRKDSDDVAALNVSMDDTVVTQKKFFWCGQPGFQLHFIQVLVLIECFYLALYVLTFAYRVNQEMATQSGFVAFLFHVLLLAPPVLVIFVLLPLLLPVFSLLSHVESMTDRSHLRYILTYDEREKARRERAHDDGEDDGHGHGGGHGGGHDDLHEPLVNSHH